MAHAADEQFPGSFVQDSAMVIRAIEDLPNAAAILADRPLDTTAQMRMRDALDPQVMDEVNAAADRLAHLTVRREEL